MAFRLRRDIARVGSPLVLTAMAAVGALCAAASLRADSTDTGQLGLLVKFKQGEALKYQTNMQLGFTLPGAAVSQPAPGSSNSAAGGSLGGTRFDVNASQEVVARRGAVAGGGDIDVTTTGQNSLPGQPPILNNDTRPVIMTYDAQGKLLGIRRQKEPASANAMFGSMLGQGLLCMQGVMLPARPVKIGETWTTQVPGVNGASASTVKSTLVRVEYLNKYRTAHLHVVSTIPVSAYLDAALQPTARATDAACTSNGTAVVTNEINFAIAEGRVIRSIGQGVMNMTVLVGKPTVPEKPAKRKKGAPAVAAPPAVAPKKPQTLKMTVRMDIDTNLVEGSKK